MIKSVGLDFAVLFAAYTQSFHPLDGTIVVLNAFGYARKARQLEATILQLMGAADRPESPHRWAHPPEHACFNVSTGTRLRLCGFR